MKKYFLVEQPPISSKYRLLVDDINETETFAMTQDIDKVLYNRHVLGHDLNITLEMYTALSSDGMTVVLPVGRYVTIWQISKDEKTQSILFVDYDTGLSFREVSQRGGIESPYSDNVYNEFGRIESLMKAGFKNEDDIIELVTVSEN